MKRYILSLLGVVCLSLSIQTSATAQAVPSKSDSMKTRQTGTQPGKAAELQAASSRLSFASTPLSFEPNLGQADANARFISRGAGYSLQLQSSGASFEFNGRDKSPSATVRMDLAGANRNAVIAGETMLLGKSDYFPTGDPKTWVTNVPTYSRVHYEDIYKGINIAFYGSANHLEYDFTVRPGADPRQIRMKLSGADNAKITNEGDLELSLGKNNVRFLKPTVYQMSSDGKTKELVSAAYDVAKQNDGGSMVAFALGAYDHRRQLIIDPVVALDYSQYLTYWVGSVNVDSSGNTYVTGNDYYSGFYVTKFNSSGAVVYTAVEGSGGYVFPDTIVVSSTGAAYVAGTVNNSAGGAVPVSTNAYQGTTTSGENAFVTVLNAAGTAVTYGSYLGGTDSSNTYAAQIAVDSTGNAYLTGQTTSATFPVTSGVYQTATPGTTGFVSKFNPAASTGAASLVYSTFLGPNGTDLFGIAVDSSNDAYVTGTANSSFPVTSGAFQYTGIDAGSGGVYVTKLNPTATALVYSAYLGYGEGYDLAVEGQSSPSVYVTGTVSGADFPTTTGAYQTQYAGGFLVKLNAAGSSEVYSTFLGGPSSYGGGTSVFPSSVSLPYGCSSSCNAYVAGWTNTTDFPQIDSIQTTASATGQSAFVTEIASTGASALFSSYVNGLNSGVLQANSQSTEGFTPAVAVDSSGNMSVAGQIYSTSDFPITTPTSNPANSFVAKIAPSSLPVTGTSTNSVSFGNQPVGVSTSVYTGTQTVHLFNLSSTAATLGAITGSPSVFSESDNCNGTIAAGGYCTLSLNFDPSAANTRSGTITIPSNASNSPSTIAVSGTGYDDGFLEPSPTSLAFATQVVGTSSTGQNVTITNIGDETVGTTIYTSTNDFSELNNCTSQLVPGASCTATVTFTPTQAGLRTDTLEILNSSGPNTTVSLSGTGTLSGGTSTLAFTAPSIQFNPQVVGTTSGTNTTYVTNTGTAPVVIQAVAASGDFSITYNSCGAPPLQINPQQACQFNVVFAPTAAGTRTGALTFTDDATGSPQSITLTGTGVASTEDVEFYPSSAVSFPDTAVTTTSGARTIYLENTGTSPMTIDRAIVSGPFALSYSTCESTVIQGSNPDGLGSTGYCQVNVTFSPTATGSQTGTLTFYDSAGNSPQTVTLSGNGIAATGTIIADPDGLTFTMQADGTTSAVQYVYLANPGNSPVTVSSITFTGTDATDFSTTGGNCGSGAPPFTVAAGQTNCYESVQFTPVAAGSRTGTMNISSTAGTTTAALAGTGVAASLAVGVTPTAMNQGTIVVGQNSAADYVYIRNTGTETVTFSANPAINGTNASDFTTANYCATSGYTLAAGATCSITVTFAPGAAGARSATLTFADNAGSQTVALSGTGESAKPTYTVSDYLISYNTQVEGTTSPLNNYVYFYNNGATSVTLGNVALSGSFLTPSGYNSCNGATIAASGNCYVYVEFAPTASGYQTGSLTFNNSGGTALSGAPVVALAGFAVAPIYSAYVNPTDLTFDSLQVVGTTSSTSTTYLYNSGNLPLTLGTVTGTDFGVAGASAEFSISSTNGGYDGCSGQTVQPGSDCQVNVTFTPNATGARTGTISFPVTYANSSTTSITGNLSGTGVAEKDSVNLVPSNLTFIDQAVGTTTPYVSTTFLVNSGNQPLTVATLTNTNTAEFSTASSQGGYDSCSGATVAASGSCQVNVVFTPSTTGTRTGTLGFPVTFADHTTSTPTLPMTGTGVATAKTIAIAPSSLQFSTEIQTDTTVALSANITSTGNQPVVIGTDSISTNSAEFKITYDSCTGRTLSANQGCTVSVAFTPSSSATGVQTGVLTIGDNATGGPHTIALSGTAITSSQQIVVSQTTLAFGNQPAGSTSSTQAVYFTNQSDTGVTINTITLGGTNSTDFKIVTNQCGGGIGAHASCYVSAQFTPATGTSGALTATISETDTGSPGSHTITLTGTAVAAGPAAALSPTTLTYSKQSVGTTSAAQSFSVTNTGSANLTVTAIASTNATEFPISVDGCSGTSLTPGQHCVASVQFSPSLGGTRTGTIRVTDNATGSPQSVALSGLGYGIPAATLTPTSLTFSSTNIASTSATQTITLSNPGTDTLNLSISLTGVNAGDFSQTNTCAATLAPAESCVVTVSFKPTASGTRSAYVTFTDNANNISGSTQSAPLTGTGVAVPSAAIAPTTLTFSSTNTGVTSAAQTATLTNSGSGPLTIASVALSGTNATDFAETNNCGQTLTAGSNCTISVTFTPAAAGTRTATVTVTDNAGNVTGSTQTLSLTGTGAGVPTAGISPSTLTFSSTNVGVSSSAQTVTLNNTGTGSLTIAGIAINGTDPGDFSDTTTCGSTLAAGGNCTVSVTFKPTVSGTRIATLTVTDNTNDTTGSTQTVSLTGTGVGVPTAAASPSTLTFSSTSIGVASAAQSVTLTNSGTGPLTIASVAISGTNAGDFAEASSCGATLVAGSNCTISVTFTPAASGSRTATLTITDNANNTTGSTQAVSLTGTGAGVPTAGISPTVVAFTDTNVGVSASAQSVTLSNTGTGSLTIASIAINGANPGDFSETSTCGSTVAAGGNCTISVTFKPTAPGNRSATLTVTDNSNNTANSTQTVSLSGTGTGVPVAGLTPSSMSFANANVGGTQAAQTATLTNTGTGPLTISSIVIGGANSGDFAETNTCGSTLVVGANCTISVTFVPTATGSRAASLHVIDNSNNVGATQTVTLSGTGTSPTAAVSPSSLTFATQGTGTTSAAQTVTLSNSGTGPLTIAGIGISGANASSFGETNTCGTTLAAGANCTISITFTPSTTGSLTATLTVTDNSGNATGSTQTVAFSGTGFNGPVVSLSPSSLSFGNENVGSSSASQSITLTNTGNATLNISSIAVTGTNASSFVFGTTCGATLAAGANCNIHGHFAPTTTGALTAAVTITDNVSDSPESVSLSGTGIGGAVSLSATSLSFGSENVGSSTASQSVTMTNSGGATLVISSIAVTGPNASSFTFSNTCGTSLAAGASCAIHGHFDPTVPGALTAAVTITDSASDSPESIALSGTGIGPIVSLSSTSLSFGDEAVGSSTASQSVTLTNTGNAALGITSIAVTGTDASSFAFGTSCGSSLAAGANCTIHGHFAPTTTGALTAAVTITDNASDSPESIALSGTGQ